MLEQQRLKKKVTWDLFFEKKTNRVLGIYGSFIYCVAAKAEAPDKAPAAGGSSLNQILGIKGAKQETVG